MYKLLTQNMTSIIDPTIKWVIGEVISIDKTRPLEFKKYGLFSHLSLDDMRLWCPNARVFEVEYIGEYITNNRDACGYSMRILREVEPHEVKLSIWAYGYCKFVKHDDKVMANIVDEPWKSKYKKYYGI